MANKFSEGSVVLLVHFPSAASMVVVNVDGEKYGCRYHAGDQYIYEVFYEHELKAGYEEVINQVIVKDDLVRHAILPSPVMLVIKDFDNERRFGCRYFANGVFYYAEFDQDELEALTDDEAEQFASSVETRRKS